MIKVPVGTLVKVESQSDFDLVGEGQRVLVARGGKGGRGNAKLRDEFGRRPRVGEIGESGEEANLTLELKLIADVGLIGLPNAGKSTLLAALTKATPKIAAYPFTTLEPNLGVLSESSVQGLESRGKRDLDASSLVTRPLVLADIPGLIEGASKGKGLGDLFLRHIVRTKVLVHLIDVSNESSKFKVQSSKLWSDYQTVRSELKAYSKELAKKKELIALNKIDQTSKDVVQAVIEEFAKHRKKALAISAKEGTGLTELANLLLKITKKE